MKATTRSGEQTIGATDGGHRLVIGSSPVQGYSWQKAGPPSTDLGWPAPLQLVCVLCEELLRHRINYCHWKSNAMLDRSAQGDNDLDLLVSRVDVTRFTEILGRLGFRQAQEPAKRQVPGVEDYYGYDRHADRLVHVHAHYQLVLGHDATKNYRLPIEEPYLASAVQGDLFRVPAPEFELMVFAMRMVLKHSTWDVILGGQGTLSVSERQELTYLQARADLGRTRDIVQQHLPYVGAILFDDCLRSLRPGCPLWKRVQVGQQLQTSLRAQARRPQSTEVWLKLWRRLQRAVQRRVLGQMPRKRMAGGGLLVAVIGGDGAGKSTAVEGLQAWLSKDFDTVQVHLGKPPWSLSTVTVRGLLKIGRLLGLYPFVRVPVAYGSPADSVAFPGYPWLLREVCTARDRNLAYAKARRQANRGSIAICDRFPLPQVTLMDGPQAERMTNAGPTNWLVRWLAAREKRYYRSIVLPELLVVLKVQPETAVERKPGEDAASVRARSSEIWYQDWQGTNAHVIDADRSREDVLSDLKSLLWSQL